jgi:hypothetical protein
MRVRTVISWDDDDPFPMGKRIDEAFNRVINFCPEVITESPIKKAFNRVVKGEFESGDLTILLEYAEVIRQRVDGRYGGSDTEVSRSVYQALVNLYTVLKEISEYVCQNLKAS